jgi:hypothetical protein
MRSSTVVFPPLAFLFGLPLRELLPHGVNLRQKLLRITTWVCPLPLLVKEALGQGLLFPSPPRGRQLFVPQGLVGVQRLPNHPIDHGLFFVLALPLGGLAPKQPAIKRGRPFNQALSHRIHIYLHVQSGMARAVSAATGTV